MSISFYRIFNYIYNYNYINYINYIFYYEAKIKYRKTKFGKDQIFKLQSILWKLIKLILTFDGQNIEMKKIPLHLPFRKPNSQMIKYINVLNNVNNIKQNELF